MFEIDACCMIFYSCSQTKTFNEALESILFTNFRKENSKQISRGKQLKTVTLETKIFSEENFSDCKVLRDRGNTYFMLNKEFTLIT